MTQRRYEIESYQDGIKEYPARNKVSD